MPSKIDQMSSAFFVISKQASIKQIFLFHVVPSWLCRSYDFAAICVDILSLFTLILWFFESL